MADSDSAQTKVDATTQCCVACHRPGSTLLKILKCLHSMCVDCVRQYVSKDGTVTCFKCLTVAASCTPGVRLQDCMVNWPAENARNDSETTALETSVSVCQDPECEGDDEIANSFCVDCDLRLCDGHGKIHAKKRTCRDHRVVASPGERCAMTRSCPLHPNSPIQKYCGQCKVLVCDRCVALNHAGHSDQVDLQTAGDQKRGDMRSRLDEVIDKWRDVLQDAKGTVSTCIQAINERTEEVSAMISDDVEELIKAIREREKDLLSQLDQARWTKVKELETQSQLVEVKSYRTECCDFLLSKLSNPDLLASEETLEDHIADIMQAVEHSPLLPAIEYDVTYQRCADVNIDLVSNLGAVLVDGCDVEQQRRSTPALAVGVAPCFDPFTVDSEQVTISKSRSQASSNATEKFSPVATLGAFCHGIVRCRFQTLGAGTGLFLGVAVQGCGRRAVCTEGKPFLGWYFSEKNASFCKGNVSGLGQPWRKGDVISLQLDCGKHQLTGVHERTGAQETITVPPGELCFGADLAQNVVLRIIGSS